MSQRSAVEGAAGSRDELRSGLRSKDSSADWKVSLPLADFRLGNPRQKEGLQSLSCRSAMLPACFEKAVFFCLDLRPPGRGRRVLLGAAAPRSTPFQPPPTTPLGFPGGPCSHGSVGSWEEPTRTTLARKGRYEGRSVEPRPARRRAVRSRADSGGELRANGALGKG